MRRKFKPRFITSKSAFTVTLIVIVLTFIIVWLQGLHLERSVLRNTALSTGILSTFLFSFMAVGLYRGYKLKDNLGDITDRFKLNTDGINTDWFPSLPVDGELVGDGCGEIILSILVWIGFTILLGIIFFIFGTVIWFSILLLLAILYWVFFRGLRFVFKKSPKCQGDFLLSIKYAGLYTFFATLWLSLLLTIYEHQNYSVVAFGSLFH